MDEKQQIRKVVFEQELGKLNSHQLITEEEYKKVSYAHKRYYEEIELNKSSPPKVDKPKPNIPVETRKALSSQETRERNISWILIIGVVLVLMSGLVLATSSWDMMNDTFKTMLISLVAGLFFGISVVADKLLKINKTAFAFWVLGSLFLPVAVLSAGYFKLFGDYLSIFGEGKYLLGVIGSILCLPVYVFSAKRYNNRLFVWISLITLSSGVAFLLAAINLKIDLFYFGIILYNGAILYLHNKLKNNAEQKLFISEVPVFAQVNLILSTLFMVAFYDNAVFYGFNILLTAALYILMVFSQGRKEYTYVFSGLVVYGIYQITENSFLADIDLLIFGMIGFVFVAFERYIKKEDLMEKIFTYTNAVVSIFAFLYISVQGILIRFEQSSWVLFFAYIAISLNYLYLSNRTPKKLFSYLTPIFFVSAAYQGYRLIQSYIIVDVESLVMFSVGVIMFVALYYKNKFKYLKTIKESGLLISLIVMPWGILSGLIQNQQNLVSFEFITLGLAFYVMYKTETEKTVVQFCRFVVPISWFIAIRIICSQIGYDEAYNLLAAVIITFATGYLWERHDNTLKKPFCYIAHMIMPIAIVKIFSDHYDEPYALIITTAIYVFSTIKSHSEWKKKVFLYATFTSGLITLFSALSRFRFSLINELYMYILPFGSLLIGICWFAMNVDWKKRTAYYLIPFNLLALFSLTQIYPSGNTVLLFVSAIICTSLEIYLMNHYKFQVFQILPLLIFVDILNRFVVSELKYNIPVSLVVLLTVAFGMKIIGELLSPELYKINKNQKPIPVFIDWFPVIALVTIHLITPYTRYMEWGDMIIPTFYVYVIYSQINRVPNGFPVNIAKTLTGFSLLIPYYTLLDKVNDSFNSVLIYKLAETELSLFPWLVIVVILSKKVWRGYEHITGKIEMIVLATIAFLLSTDLTGFYQLSEGFILGVLTLTSIIGGMHFKKKSFFFIGSATLIYNVLIQTRDFWGNMPWWVYLLVAGMVLIGTASLNELQKDKKVIKIDKNTILDKFKNWN